VTWTDSRATLGALKLASVGFVGIPAHDIKINPMPKIQVIINILFLFIIKPPFLSCFVMVIRDL
jgi:hypothetical protein